MHVETNVYALTAAGRKQQLARQRNRRTNVTLRGAIITIDQTIMIAEGLGLDVRLD